MEGVLTFGVDDMFCFNFLIVMVTVGTCMYVPKGWRLWKYHIHTRLIRRIYLLSLQCRDTFYIESFHVVVLIYAPKRIHFGDGTYKMRVNLAILDWVSALFVCYANVT